MTGVEFAKDISASPDAFSPASTCPNTSADTNNSSTPLPEQQEQHTSEEEQAPSSFAAAGAEWDPVEFDLKNSSNPKWRCKNKKKSPTKPKRIQDIRLSRLDSGESGSSSGSRQRQQSFNDSWPYEDEPTSPCAMFGKNNSSPAEGFEQTGEFSNGDPEWGDDDQNSKKSSGSRERRRSATTSSSDKRRKERRKQRQPAKQEEDSDEEGDGDDQSVGSGSNSEPDYGSQSGSEGEEDLEGDYSDEGSYSHSSNPDDDNLMVTPDMRKIRDQQRKKPPTLKRGAHGVATPSIVKAMKDKQAFTSDDEGDNHSIDFDFEDSDAELDSGGSGHSSRSRSRDNGSRSKRDSRLDAANATFRKNSVSKRREKFAIDRSMSSADMKAARKANNSFKGQTEMNKSFGVLAEKRRSTQRSKSGISKDGKFQNSFSSSGHSRKSSSGKSSSPTEKGAAKGLPARAKSLGNPTGGSKLKSALASFSGAAEPTSNTNATGGKKTYGSTLSALKALSGGDTGGGGKNEDDLKNSIMQQVYASSSGLNPIEMKRKPKPKMTTSGTRAAAAAGDLFAAKDSSNRNLPSRVRRSRTASEKNLSSLSDFNASYHESISKMRKQKMADASERSAQSGISRESTRSADSEDSSKRPGNLERRAKSFSHSRMAGAMDAGASPGPSPGARPRLQRGNSKRSVDNESGLDGKSPRRNLSKSGSRRQLVKERIYDADIQPIKGTSVVTLLKQQEPVTDAEMMQKGNRQMFHALMYKTRMGIDMDRIRRKVEGLEVSESEREDDKADAEDQYEDESGSDSDR